MAWALAPVVTVFTLGSNLWSDLQKHWFISGFWINRDTTIAGKLIKAKMTSSSGFEELNPTWQSRAWTQLWILAPWPWAVYLSSLHLSFPHLWKGDNCIHLLGLLCDSMYRAYYSSCAHSSIIEGWITTYSLYNPLLRAWGSREKIYTLWSILSSVVCIEPR